MGHGNIYGFRWYYKQNRLPIHLPVLCSTRLKHRFNNIDTLFLALSRRCFHVLVVYKTPLHHVLNWKSETVILVGAPRAYKRHTISPWSDNNLVTSNLSDLCPYGWYRQDLLIFTNQASVVSKHSYVLVTLEPQQITTDWSSYLVYVLTFYWTTCMCFIYSDLSCEIVVFCLLPLLVRSLHQPLPCGPVLFVTYDKRISWYPQADE